MLSLIETVERLRRGEMVPENDLAAHQNSTNAVERFLAHSALSMIAMQSARDHMIDALRAIDYADRQVLQQYIELCGVLRQPAGVAQAVVRFGQAMVTRGQWAPALEAMSQAVSFDSAGELTADESAWAAIADTYEQACRALGRTVNTPAPSGGPVRVALLTSRLVDDSPTDQFLNGWMRHANPDLASIRLYSTETSAKPTRHGLALTPACPSSQVTGARLIAEAKARRIDTWMSPPEADAIQTARILTERLVRDQIELLIVDASLADPAIGMAIASRPAARQIALARGPLVPLAGIDEIIFTDLAAFPEQSPLLETRSIATRSIFQGIESSSVAAARRSDFGLSDDATVLMTCAEQTSETSAAFLKVVARLLAEHPRAVYLLAGEGDTTSAKRIFEAAGVSKRVGYASKLRDVRSFVSMADLYLAEFPRSSRSGVLTAMSLAKPVMILAGEHDQPGNARFVGAPYAVVGSPATLTDRCVAMIRDPQLRATVGANLARRAADKFSLKQTVEAFMQLAVAAGKSRAKSTAPMIQPSRKAA